MANYLLGQLDNSDGQIVELAHLSLNALTRDWINFGSRFIGPSEKLRVFHGFQKSFAHDRDRFRRNTRSHHQRSADSGRRGVEVRDLFAVRGMNFIWNPSPDL